MSLLDRLLRRLLPGELGDALTGDLWEETSTRIRPRHGRVAAWLWFLGQAVRSLPGAIRLRRVSPLRGGGPDRSGSGLDGVRQDLRYAARGLAARPGFTAAVLATLALGIGANTAIFSAVRGVVLRPLPYHEPGQLVRVWPGRTFPFGLRSALRFQEQARAYQAASAYGRGLFTLTGDGDPEILRGARVQANHFTTLGVEPLLGRGFTADEGTGTGARVAVLSHGLWQRRFGSDPAVVGRSVDISGQRHTVVGVMDPGHLPLEADWEMWVPVRVTEEALDGGAGMAVIGRLAPGVTPLDAGLESRRLYREARREAGETATAAELAGLRVVSLQEWLVGETGPRLMVLLGAVGLVLLIAAANVANLLLAQGSARARELAVRRALGASPTRIVRQLLTESLLLGALGGALGVGLAYLALVVGLPHLPADLPRAGAITLDGAVLAFAAAVSVGTAVLAGTAPALRARMGADAGALQEGGRAGAGARRLRLNQALVTAQVALAVVLVAGSGLMLRSLLALSREDPGFDPVGVLTLRVSPPDTYDGGEQVVAFHQAVEEAVGALPGVRSVGAIQFMPMRPGGWWSEFHPADEPLAEGVDPGVSMRVVTAEYFSAMGIEVKAGRAFEARDHGEAPAAVLVNQALARRAWPDRNPVGRTLLLGVDEPRPYTVVGVVADVRQQELRTPADPEAYLPMAQRAWWSLFYAVRVDGDPGAAARAVRDAVWSVHAGAPISSVSPLSDVVGATVADTRFFTGLLTAFGMLALVLGAVGVYGLMSYVVSLRRREIGIRLALGALGERVLASTVARGMLPVGLGLLLGLAGALAAGRALSGALYQVAPGDPATLAGVSAVLVVAALAALYVPARRASRVDPMRVLRDV